ncbi:MAG: TIGR03086 family metal-binding protein [Acidimicrobiia bacterium]|nr:TIGR03086 family metal-binding protein [Acidimicrobiia bacterium]
MDATTALGQTNDVMSSVIAQLTPNHREQSTPCTEWNVHQVIEHVCQGSHMVAGALQQQAPAEGEAPDLLANGPADGWANAHAALAASATPENLSEIRELPGLGAMPGEVAMSVIVADAVTHAWDVAKGTGVTIEIPEDLAAWALTTWQQVVPAEGRGGGFAEVVPVGDDASAVDRLVGWTGRQP